jgi:hypothetical protein
MRPRLTLWSDYGTPARRYRMSAAVRAARLSIGRKIFLTGIVFIAAVIGVHELYGQAADKRGLSAAVGDHSHIISQSNVNVTGRRSIAAIPLSPQPVPPADEATVGSHAPVSAPEHSPAPALISVTSEDKATPALSAIPGALAKASALPPTPAALAAAKAGGKSRGATSRRVAQVARHPGNEIQPFVHYADVIAKLGRNKELRAALRLFL